LLSIITISYGDKDGLASTIDSVMGQDCFQKRRVSFEHIVVVSGLSQETNQALANAYDGSGVKFIFDKDNGLYNAMNIGLSFAKGSHVYFLNGGDKLLYKNSLQTILNDISSNCISLFRVCMSFNDVNYIRPGNGGKFRNRKIYSHQGFIAPLNEHTPRFDESKIINADTKWMTTCLQVFLHKKNNDIIAKFGLGGLSNKPTLKTVELRYENNGPLRGALELLKLSIAKTLGLTLYYRLLSIFNGYEIYRAPKCRNAIQPRSNSGN
jgi:glycosyltransferase involved in cell wall biosynthesis